MASKDEETTGTAPSVEQVSHDIQHGNNEQEKSAEQEEREQAVKDQQIEQIENDQLNLNPFNANESAHQRWLETGQTEPPFMIPEQSEDEDEGEDEGQPTAKKTTARKASK